MSATLAGFYGERMKLREKGAEFIARKDPERAAERKPLPSQSELKRLSDYDSAAGSLCWRACMPDMFRKGRHSAESVCQRWNKAASGKAAFRRQGAQSYLRGTIFNTTSLTHRIIWRLVTGKIPDRIDHENGVKTHNRTENFQDVSASENKRISPRPKNNRSGAVGVCWCRRPRRWTPHITVRPKHINLGTITRKPDAIAARKAGDRQHNFHANYGRQQ